MKIGVISDTHLEGSDDGLCEIVEKHFYDVDLILHAGDLGRLSLRNVFGEKKVVAVHGNTDHSSVKSKLPRTDIVPIGRFRIGLIHGDGNDTGQNFDEWIRNIEDRIREEFDDVNCIVYGHTHYPVIHHRKGILFLNPGTPNPFARHFGHNSVGILEVGDEEITGQIIYLDEG
jgi:uncharacterized protein